MQEQLDSLRTTNASLQKKLKDQNTETEKLNLQCQEQIKNYGQILESKQIQNREMKQLKDKLEQV